MDRLTRSLAFCGFGLLLTASGCKMTRPEVPPGRPYAKDGRQRPAIDFSSAGHPVDGSAMTNMVPDSAGASKLGQGLGSGMGRPGAPLIPEDVAGVRPDRNPSDGAVLPAGSDPMPRSSNDPNPNPSTTPPTTLPPDAEPKPEIAPPASQAVVPSMDSPGRMGRANDFPSPN